MVEEQKMEQRSQAVKRLRSLFDMHRISFGAPENLGPLLLSLHENRHFAMDFWSVVNAVSEGGSGSLNDEEVLEAVVESSTGVLPNVLPEYERPGVQELRQMLAGVDVERPAEPAPLSSPTDPFMPKESAAANPVVDATPPSNDETQKTRRSIGEALAKLEQSTRELREQLAQIDAEMARAQTPPVAAPQAPVAAATVAAASAADAKSAEDQLAETLSKWNRIADKLESLGEPRPQSAVREHALPPFPEVVPVQPSHPPSQRFAPETTVQPQPVPASSTPVVPIVPIAPSVPPAFSGVQPVAAPIPPSFAEPGLPSPAATVRDAFASRPARPLTHRGLATPDPTDNPFIVAPLSHYTEEPERSSVARFAMALVVIGALAAAGFYATRTDTGQAMLHEAVSVIHDKYNSAMGHSDTTESSAPKPADTAAPQAQGDTTSAQTPPDSLTSSAPSATSTSGIEPAASVTASPGSSQSASTPTPEAVRRRNEVDASAARSNAPEPIVDASVLHVPSSTMAANLIFSRVPAYPEPAREQGIEGSVVMDVVISQSGTVKYVRVIDGDRHLRLAAEDAVMRWRYKPYVQNGSPMEVATTVRVDFRLPR